MKRLIYWALACATILLRPLLNGGGYPETSRVSAGPAGVQPNNNSTYSAISADGRYVAFGSMASNLVPNDTNDKGDTFLLDRSSGVIIRVSVASDGTQANGYSMGFDYGPSISADGRYVAFGSAASNLVPDDTNGRPDIFVYDRVTGQTRRISVASDGTQGNSGSSYPSISADGRYVAFTSAASNFMGDYSDNNMSQDVFVHDLKTRQTFRVSVRSDGSPASGVDPVISADGRYIAFLCWESLVPEDTNNQADIYVRDRLLGTTALVSKGLNGQPANGSCDYSMAISADGRFIAFNSTATNLELNHTNTALDVFVFDQQNQTTELVNVTSEGLQSDIRFPAYSKIAMSADGRYVSFTTDAQLDPGDAQYLDLYVRDRLAGVTRWVTVSTNGTSANDNSYDGTSISADGRCVVFRSKASNLVTYDTNNIEDVFLREYGPREFLVTVTAVDDSAGETGNDPAVFEFRRQGMINAPLTVFFAVHGTASNGVDYALIPNAVTIPAGAETVQLVVQPLADSLVEPDETVILVLTQPPVSQYYHFGVSYVATATIRGDPLVEAISVSTNGDWGNKYSSWPAISADGRYVAFRSDATNLVAGDTNKQGDIFAMDRQTRQIMLASVATNGTPANGSSGSSIARGGLAISGDGRYVVFQSVASNLVPNDTNGIADIFVYDLQTHTTRLVNRAYDGSQTTAGCSLPAISQDGRYIAFISQAENLVTNDSNGVADAFVFDQNSGTTEIVSVASGGTQGNQAVWTLDLSADGRFIAFSTSSSTLVAGDTNTYSDVFLRDRQTGVTECVSRSSSGELGNLYSSWPSVSADGRYIAFMSASTNLVAGDTNRAFDVFVHDRTTQETRRVSVADGGRQANYFYGYTNTAYYPRISADGRYVAFFSHASDLVAGDANGSRDIFVHDCQTVTTRRVSVTRLGAEASNGSEPFSLSADGRFLAFQSVATDIVPGDTNTVDDIFVIQLLPSASTPSGGFASWTALTFPPGTPADDMLPGADPDGDGIVNLVEYAFGQNPMLPDRIGLPRAFISTHQGQKYLSISYRRSKPVPADIIYQCIASPVVSTWNSPLPTTTQEVDWGDYTEVIITLASPSGSLAQGFLQTQIQQR